MTPNDKPHFVKLLAGIAQLYGKELSSISLDIYWGLLSRYTLPTVEQALKRHVGDKIRGRFMPLPADVIFQIDDDGQALVAWSKVTQALQVYGVYSTLVFDDALIHAVITDMGGWIRLCGQRQDQLPFYQREFEQRYQRYLRFPPSDYPRALTGQIEHTNQCYGYRLHAPSFYGDEKRALQVYQGGALAEARTQRLTGRLPLEHLAKTPALAAPTADALLPTTKSVASHLSTKTRTPV